MTGTVSRMFVFAAIVAVVAVLGTALVSHAQRNAAAKANGEYNSGFWGSQSHSSQSGNFRSGEGYESRRSYSYEPSQEGQEDSDVAAKGAGCAPKMSSKSADDSKAQAKKQDKAQSKQQAKKQDKQESHVHAKKQDKKQSNNAQAKKQQSRRTFSHDPSNKSDKPEVAAKGRGCGPKLNYKAGEKSKAQAKKQNSRRTFSQEPSEESESSKQNWSKGEKDAWDYQKSNPKRYED